MNKAPYGATFDAASGMFRALSHLLHGHDFAGFGIFPTVPLVADLFDLLGEYAQRLTYVWGGWVEAMPPGKLKEVRAEHLREWVVDQLPKRRYPGIMVGSSNGAATHLCAAMGIPWLPQTFLIPVRHPGLDPDKPIEVAEWARGPAADLLANNPDLVLHQMHDPSQDRLMIQRMAYFRTKFLRLGEAYRRFMEECLEPEGTIYLIECQADWPTTEIAPRHYFQMGAIGGLDASEFIDGSERLERFLQRHGSSFRHWEAPKPDARRPEAEWGFEEPLRTDVEQFAREQGFRLERIVFREPEDMSPLVADLHDWWYSTSLPALRRLLVESFIVLDPGGRRGPVPSPTGWCSIWTRRQTGWRNTCGPGRPSSASAWRFSPMELTLQAWPPSTGGNRYLKWRASVGASWA